MRQLRIPHRDDRGVVAIEFVFILPFLLMLFVGFLVLGNALSVKAQASNEARDAARTYAIGRGLNAGAVIVSGSCPQPPAAPNPNNTVTISVTKPLLLRDIPVLGTVLPEDTTETVVMRCGG